MCEPTEVSIRSANSGDLDTIARVWHESAVHMDGANAPMPSQSDLRHRIDVELQAGWALYVAIANAQIVGLLVIKPSEAVLDQIFVSPQKQGRGVGRALLNWAKRAMPEGFTLRMALSNYRAGRFYEKEGLKLLREGEHPLCGYPVCYYGWGVS